MLGQGELWVSSHLLSLLGANVLAIYLLVARLIPRDRGDAGRNRSATGTTVAGTSRALKRSSEEIGGTMVRRPATGGGEVLPGKHAGPESLLPPSRTPRSWSSEQRTSRPRRSRSFLSRPRRKNRPSPGSPTNPRRGLGPSSRAEPEAAGLELAPGGSRSAGRSAHGSRRTRTSIGECPPARFLTRWTGEAAKPDTAGQERVARTLLETLGHFGVEAKVIGRVTGPHITRYELRLAPGTRSQRSPN